MHPQFACLTPHWFYRAYVYTGSIGDFRYRFDRDADVLTIFAPPSECEGVEVKYQFERFFPA